MFCILACALYWRMLHLYLKRMYILVLDGIFYICLRPSVYCIDSCLNVVFCLMDLPIDVSVLIMSSSIIVSFSISLWLFYLLYIFKCSYVWYIDIYNCYILFWIDPFIICNALVSCYSHCFKVHFSWCKYCLRIFFPLFPLSFGIFFYALLNFLYMSLAFS